MWAARRTRYAVSCDVSARHDWDAGCTTALQLTDLMARCPRKHDERDHRVGVEQELERVPTRGRA
jgi:hypothetical protein